MLDLGKLVRILIGRQLTEKDIVKALYTYESKNKRQHLKTEGETIIETITCIEKTTTNTYNEEGLQTTKKITAPSEERIYSYIPAGSVFQSENPFNYVVKIARILKGTQLSKRKTRRAEQGVIISKEKRHYILEKTVEGFKENQTLYEYTTTEDASHGWAIPHTGWYPFYIETRIYSEEGLLKEKAVHGSKRGNALFLKDRKYEYYPEGRLHGQKIF